nr:MAG TPA: hypothetical protein [Bacteriophage sp.]
MKRVCKIFPIYNIYDFAQKRFLLKSLHNSTNRINTGNKAILATSQKSTKTFKFNFELV